MTKVHHGQAREAEESILQGMKTADEINAKPHYTQGNLFLGGLCTHSGEKEKALANLTRAETMFGEMDLDYWLGESRKLSGGV